MLPPKKTWRVSLYIYIFVFFKYMYEMDDGHFFLEHLFLLGKDRCCVHHEKAIQEIYRDVRFRGCVPPIVF